MFDVATKTTTVQEFLEMDFEEGYLYELINGEIGRRGSPNTAHQRTSRDIFRHIDNFVYSNRLGECFYAPYDVVFDRFNLAQPDILFVSNENAPIIKKGCIEGTPDLIVEILSRGTHRYDRGEKLKLYRNYGVKEYWIVDPVANAIEVYTLQKGDYDLAFFASETGEVESLVLPGLKIPVAAIFS